MAKKWEWKNLLLPKKSKGSKNKDKGKKNKKPPESESDGDEPLQTSSNAKSSFTSQSVI